VCADWRRRSARCDRGEGGISRRGVEEGWARVATVSLVGEEDIFVLTFTTLAI